MKRLFLAVFALLMCVPAFAQNPNQTGFTDQAEVHVGRTRPFIEAIQRPHTYHVEGRHWPINKKPSFLARAVHTLVFHPIILSPDCAAAKQAFDSFGTLPAPGSFDEQIGCGQKFLDYDGENLVTSAGEDAISSQMGNTSTQAAACNYVALTNTAITPAKGDTTLSGEIGSNGLQRAQGTYANTSAAIGALSAAGTPTIVGTTGAATLDYWPVCHTYQGYTGVPASGGQTTTANATLSTANYVTVTFTGKLGCTDYVVVRTNSGSQPSGSLAGGAAQSNSGIIGGYISCSNSGLIAGTAPTCTAVDQSNTTAAFTIPGSDQTYAGSFTISKTFTATGTQSAQAFGIFNASSVGTLCFEGTFTSASLITNDTLAFTETVYH